MVKQVWPMVFNSNAEFGAYAKNHPEVFHSYSPGGVAALLNVSRQRVHELFEAGKLRAWVIHERMEGISGYLPGGRASYIYISADDVWARKESPRDRGGRPPRSTVQRVTA